MSDGKFGGVELDADGFAMPPLPPGASAAAVVSKAGDGSKGAAPSAKKGKKGKKKKKLALFEPPQWATKPKGDASNAVLEELDDDGNVGRRIAVGERACTVIGRNEDLSDVTINEPNASRKHMAVLFCGAERQFYILDLQSTHGTFVNGRPIPPMSRVPLEPKDTVRVGEGNVRLRMAMAAIAKVGPSAAQLARAHAHEKGNAGAGGGAGAGAGGGMGSAYRKQRSDAGRPKPADDGPKLTDEQLREQLPTAFGGGVAAKQQRGVKRSAEEMHDAFKRVASGKKFVVKKARTGDDDEDGSGDSDDDLGPKPAGGDDADGAEDGGDEGGKVEEASGEDLERVADELELPISHEIMLKGHTKTVMALAFDAAGSRLATGGNDYVVRMYDFGGMDRARRAFRTMTPEDGYGVVAIAFSPSGDKFAVATGSPKIKVFDRDGAAVIGTIRGDMYLHDPTRTPGHTHPNTGVQWHPRTKDRFMSCSSDGTIRLWNLDGKTTFNELRCDQCIRVKNIKGLRTSVTAARFDKKGKKVFCVEESGSLQWFELNNHGRYHRPSGMVKGAHEQGGASSLTLSPDNRTLVSRGRWDETMKVWDVRNCTKPVLTFTGLPNLYDSTGVTFRPDGRLVLTPVSVPLGKGTGQVKVFDLKAAAEGNMEPVYTMNVAEGASAVSLVWQPNIQQVAIGCADGATRLMYHPKKSKNGALISNARAPKRRDLSDYITPVNIHNPNSLPMYREDPTGRTQRAAARKDPVLTKKPEVGSAGPKKRDKIKTTSFAQFIRKSKLDNKHLEEDPREALLKYAQRATDKPQWVDVAYTQTQPDSILMTKTLEEEEIEKKKMRDGTSGGVWSEVDDD